jgi:hypothetical protein
MPNLSWSLMRVHKQWTISHFFGARRRYSQLLPRIRILHTDCFWIFQLQPTPALRIDQTVTPSAFSPLLGPRVF